MRKILIYAFICSFICSSVMQLHAEENTNLDSQQEETILIAEDDTEYSSIEDGTDTDLLQMYLDKELLGKQNNTGGRKAPRKTAGQYLEGYDLVAYNELKPQIEQVASGQITSTVFNVSLEAAGLADQVWTAEDLGVDAIVVNGAINPEASAALRERIKINNKKVLQALLSDLPYDFYWFDKTTNWSISGFVIAAKGYGGEYVMYVKGDSIFKLPVSQDFGSGFETDPVIISGINNAVTNAQNIVSAHADEMDHEKVNSYKDEILDLVNYNYDAANNDPPYGNPWQVIWVFDGDNTTDVVCEGYSKAFKYLCDMTNFRNKNIVCYTVSGTMDGGSGEGAHMWNVITMDDGNNYLADLTNIDENTIGEGDCLYLQGVIYDSDYSYHVDIPERDMGSYIILSDTIYYEYDEETIEQWDSTGILSVSTNAYEYTEPVNNTLIMEGSTLLLDGTINVNFYVNVDEEKLNQIKAVATINDQTFEIEGEDAVYKSEDVYSFKIPVAAKECNDEIMIRFVDEENEPVEMETPDGRDVTEGYAYSLGEYLRNVSETENMKALCDALLNYTGYAQIYFKLQCRPGCCIRCQQCYCSRC